MTNKIKEIANDCWMNVEETEHFYYLTSKGSMITKSQFEMFNEITKDILDWFITTRINDYDSFEAALTIIKGRV